MKNKTLKEISWKMTAMTMAGALCFLTACSGGSADAAKTETTSADTETAVSEDAGSQELQNVTLLLDWTPNTNHTGLYVARDLGYFEEEGLNVDIEIPYEETATQLVATGKGEFGISNTEDVINARSLEDAMPVESIAAIIQNNTSGFVSLAEEEISSPADWEGKTYGGYGGTTEEEIVRTIAADNGVDPDSISFVTLGNSDTLTALKTDIDFAWVFEAAELLLIEQQGAACNYLPVRDYGDAFNYYTPVIIVNTDVADKDPEMVSAFMRAVSKGYDYAIDHPQEAAEILLAAEPDLDEELVTEGQKYLSERYAKDAPQWGWQEEAVWQKYADFLYENDLIAGEVDVTQAFTNEYLPAE